MRGCLEGYLHVSSGQWSMHHALYVLQGYTHPRVVEEWEAQQAGADQAAKKVRGQGRLWLCCSLVAALTGSAAN